MNKSSQEKEPKSLNEIANTLSRLLLTHGFIIHRYDAYKTNSIYLKLDYGACGSIRISDHEGYKHLSYRWNIGSHIENTYHEKKPYKRSYYPTRKWPKMITSILKEREERQEVKGQWSYENRIANGMRQKQNAKKGFWAHPETKEVHYHDLDKEES